MIAKGKVFISEVKIIELLGLDENIEIVSVNNKMGEGLEFNIASKLPINGLTHDRSNWDNMRRVIAPR